MRIKTIRKWRLRRHRQARERVIGCLYFYQGKPGVFLMKMTGLSSSRLYTALATLEETGHVSSHWDDSDTHRKLYRLKERGYLDL